MILLSLHVGSFLSPISYKLQVNLQEILRADLHFLSIHGHIFVRIFVAFLLDTINRFYLTQYSKLLCVVSRSNGTGLYQHKNAFYYLLLSLFSFRQPSQERAIYLAIFC